MVDQNPNTKEAGMIEPPPKEVFNPFMDEGIVDENNMDSKGRDGWHRPPLVDLPEESEMVAASVRSWAHNSSQKRAKEREVELRHASRSVAQGEFTGAEGEALQKLLAPTTGPREGEERKDNESNEDFRARILQEREKHRAEEDKKHKPQHQERPSQDRATGPEHERKLPEHGPATGPQPTKEPTKAAAKPADQAWPKK